MPSVEMRRSTRVFVPKAKDCDFVRVLRSGRRLWVDSEEVKLRGNKNGDEWFSLIDKDKEKKNGWHPKVDDSMDIDEKKPVFDSVNLIPGSKNERSSCERVIKHVYSRKRKRLCKERGDFEREDRKFGLHFVRRQRRRKVEGVGYGHDHDYDDGGGGGGVDDGLLSVLVEPFQVGYCLVSRVLGLILGYMSRKDVLLELSAFMVSSPLSNVFASVGIHFSRGLPYSNNRGLCRIFGTKQFVPLFALNFSAAPLCFMHLHWTMWFSSMRLSWLCWIDFNRKSESIDEDSDEHLPIINDQSDQSLNKVVRSYVIGLECIVTEPKISKKAVNSSAAGKLGVRNAHSRNGVITRSRSKKRHRSLRPRRARSLSRFDPQKASGPPVSHHLVHKKNPSSSSSGRNQELRRSARRCSDSASVTHVPKLSSSALSLNVDIDSQCCSANLLVLEPDKCYRVEGVEIALDISDSNEWILAVKKDGLKRHCLKAQREMKPCTTNRYTHSVIWAGDSEWKLEFPERKEWLAFKELYKACMERNVVPTSPVVKIIPVPGVREVTNAWDSTSATFKRPDSYIRMTSDELSRALSSRTANYDMDSEDEDWLRKLNSKLDDSDNVSEETFELMIDALEKASYCNPEDGNDGKTAVNLCTDLASLDLVEEVHQYWLQKKKQKSSPLLMVFQLNQPKRALLVSKPVLRKKRSLKRQASQHTRGRGKDSTVLQAIAAEQSAVEEQNAILRLEEAKASANKSLEVATNKRQRAQMLMENADLAMYRATMALRIADAARISDTHQAATHFLDW